MKKFFQLLERLVVAAASVFLVVDLILLAAVGFREDLAFQVLMMFFVLVMDGLRAIQLAVAEKGEARE